MVDTKKTIHDLRIERLWSVNRLAKEAGVSDKTIRRAELGQPIQEISAVKIARALDVNIKDIDGLILG